jgi:hypothetical protein
MATIIIHSVKLFLMVSPYATLEPRVHSVDQKSAEPCLVLWFIAIGCVLGRACVLADAWPLVGASNE